MEILSAMWGEIVGNDPATRRAGALPYMFAAVSVGGYNALGDNDVRQEVSGPLGP